MSTRRASFLFGMALCAAIAAPAAAQEAELPTREDQYRSARSLHESALYAWSAVEKQWSDAVDAQARARAAGDEDRWEQALTRSLDLARELSRLERRVEEAQEALADARIALLVAIDGRIGSLELQMEAVRTTAERGRLAAVVRDLENQQAQLTAEAEVGLRTELVYYQSIQYDPRDDAETLAAKAELLRSKAEQADSVMAQIDREIERLERQVRRTRNVQSLVTGVERFGDIQAPGAPGRTPPPGVVGARPDSTGVARPSLTPEQRLQELELLRARVESARLDFLRRAGTFDTLIRRIG